MDDCEILYATTAMLIDVDVMEFYCSRFAPLGKAAIVRSDLEEEV